MMVREEIRVNLDLEAGGCLADARVVFHHSPFPPGGRRVIWICHALTANSNPEDWWPEMVGPFKTIDDGRDYVVCVNMLGSPYGSESPASVNPGTGRPWLLDFPLITFRDVTASFEAVRKYLGIEKIDLIIGASSGGFEAVEWAVSSPGLFGRCFFMATAPRISPFLAACNETQRMALEADPSFRLAAGLQGGAVGLRCARAQALISYRSFGCYEATQAETDEDALCAARAASYQRYQGEKLVRRGFDAYSYYSICNTLDTHNVGRGRGGVKAALGRIEARTTVVSIDSDAIFPPEEGRRWAAMIPGAEFKVFSSLYGHDGFLLETAKISAILMS